MNPIEVFPKWIRAFSEFGESDKSLKRELDCGSVLVASCSLTQEVACLSPFTVVTHVFVIEFAKFSENI